jgi:hypothetical protein
MELFALVHLETGKLVNETVEMCIPWEAETLEEAELEAVSTIFCFSFRDEADPRAALASKGWKIVPITPELEAAYRRLGEEDAAD